MRELERQADTVWRPPAGVSAIAAFDFFFLDILPNRPKYDAPDMQLRQSHVKIEKMQDDKASVLGVGSSGQAATAVHAHYERLEHTSNTEPSRGQETKKRRRRKGNNGRRSPFDGRGHNDERQTDNSRGRPHGNEWQDQDRPQNRRIKSEDGEKMNLDSSFEEGQFMPEKRPRT